MISKQWTLKGITVAIINDGIWWRVKQWNNEGYWITWSTNRRFGERIKAEKALWQIGRGIHFRIACFFLDEPGWSTLERHNKDKLRLVK